MRVPAALAAAMLGPLSLAGCHRAPSFDERYASAEHAIMATAAGIDAELAARASEAAEASEAASASPGTGPLDRAIATPAPAPPRG